MPSIFPLTRMRGLGVSAPTWSGPRSDHFDGERFHHAIPVEKSAADVIRWARTRSAAAWPERIEDPIPVTPATRIASGELVITPVNHATVLVQIDGLNLLTDPLWSQRCSPSQWAGPARVHAPAVSLDDLPPIDAILVSHNHYDHLDLPTLTALEAVHAAPVITPLNNAYIIRRAGVPAGRIVELDWWQSTTIGGATITATPAQHWSRRGLTDTRKSLWSGFLIAAGGASVFFAGDSGYGSLFRRIHDRLGAPDVALLPIGAYEPRWFMKAQHMNPAEAVQAMLDLRASTALGIHWGTFRLTDEAREAPLQALAEARETKGLTADQFAAAVPGTVYPVRVPATAGQDDASAASMA